jgi:hypothetical protein
MEIRGDQPDFLVHLELVDAMSEKRYNQLLWRQRGTLESIPKEILHSSRSVFTGFVYFSKQTAIISLKNIKRLVFNSEAIKQELNF